jgi:hypothetical protein
MNTPRDLDNTALLAQYTALVRWKHYDPSCVDRPSPFDLEDLESELRFRLDRSPVSRVDAGESESRSS